MLLPTSSVMIIGASRGLGLGLVQEYLKRGWHVVATIRGDHSAALHTLTETQGERLEVERLDINKPEEIALLRTRLSERRFEMLFVNAGVTNNPTDHIGDVTTAEFIRVMTTNALGPMRVIEALQDLVPPNGTIAVMSSGLGSVADNETGGWEVYRASKAALNMLMRSFAARVGEEQRSILVVAPGWVRTEMGGPQASLDVETSICGVVDMVSANTKPGIRYLNYQAKTVPW